VMVLVMIESIDLHLRKKMAALCCISSTRKFYTVIIG
jgi:hypothetical protein